MIGLLSFYGATKAKAETFEGKAAEEIVYRGEIVSETWDETSYHTRVKYKNRYYGCYSRFKWDQSGKDEHYLFLTCVTAP